ncbi:hypothetical protein [Spirulina sp. 06S082]|uniref:hypothetical protein n=1 Tax=Spirulina sp. 06S082 TaxID=3110248 RepID=UPI002B1F9842|nr:hypothetical protein [Spirulina sp. 06S082]MEA5472465.1 hypothetical protein [Spirulina sp. 06S082]
MNLHLNPIGTIAPYPTPCINKIPSTGKNYHCGKLFVNPSRNGYYDNIGGLRETLGEREDINDFIHAEFARLQA